MCLKNILTEEDVKIARKKFWQRDQEDQRSYILQYFEMFLLHNGTLEFSIKGTVVCRNAWLTTHKISNGRYVLCLKRTQGFV